MSADKINIAIAEACGYTNVREADYTDWITDPYADGPSQMWVGDHSEHGEERPIPNYHGDLNAMREAEKVLDSYAVDTRSLYLDTLSTLVEIPLVTKAAELNFEIQYASVRATAAQRAEAFLRTLGKWKEAA